MLGFAETIAEFFHSESVLIWNLVSNTHAVANFEVRSVAVRVDFEQREPSGPWHVSFDTVSGVSREPLSIAFRIFNGVFQAVKEFTAVREPECLVFIAKDEDLAGIYATYLRRDKPQIEALGYSLEGPFVVEPYTQWTLRRLREGGWKN